MRMGRAMGCLAGAALLAAGCQPPGQPAALEARAGAQAEKVRVRLLDRSGKPGETIIMEKIAKTDAEWRSQLTEEQYRITRRKGTEPAFCGAFFDHKKPGIYCCVCCDLPLFSATAKFDSGTGWPSFFEPIAPENIATVQDRSHGMVRTEIVCVRCDAHLGHVFEDGPPPTGLRYCLNSASLVFREQKPEAGDQ